jgi:hypothetical protein
MTPKIKPWIRGPFEVLLHAEMHYRQSDDFDRRIAMISFDNAIEFAIAAYLNLKPIHRSGRSYNGEDVPKWLKDYHTRLEFFFEECGRRGVVSSAVKEEVVWVHNVRNEQYHEGRTAYPGAHVFSVLFDEPDVETLLQQHLEPTNELPVRTEVDDIVIDDVYGSIEVCGTKRRTSEVLYALDPNRYRQTADEIRATLEEGD